jgi:soluble lytic murein transglycosylase-like protein
VAAKTYDEIKALVAANNKAKYFKDTFVICLIWKESGFDPDIVNSKSTATGLMQMTKGAVISVNSNTPKGTHFEHSDMTDPALNVQCGTYYLDIARNKLGGVDTSYGTGPGYSDSIVKCELCLKAGKEHAMKCLHLIHL